MAPRRSALVLFGMTAVGLVVLLMWMWSKPRPLPPVIVDGVVISKRDHTLSLYGDGKVLAIYHVALGRGGRGSKLQAGDDRVPEGTYPVVSRNPHSLFYRSLRLGYPTEQQRAQARSQGIDPGGDIMIHGIRNGLGWVGNLHRQFDWTRGCIAVTDAEMDQIWTSVPVGTPVQIQP